MLSATKPQLWGLIRIAPGETRCTEIYHCFTITEWLNLLIVSCTYTFNHSVVVMRNFMLFTGFHPVLFTLKPLRGLLIKIKCNPFPNLHDV